MPVCFCFVMNNNKTKNDQPAGQTQTQPAVNDDKPSDSNIQLVCVVKEIGIEKE